MAAPLPVAMSSVVGASTEPITSDVRPLDVPLELPQAARRRPPATASAATRHPRLEIVLLMPLSL
jgi:hypothetical protein